MHQTCQCGRTGLLVKPTSSQGLGQVREDRTIGDSRAVLGCSIITAGGRQRSPRTRRRIEP